MSDVGVLPEFSLARWSWRRSSKSGQVRKSVSGDRFLLTGTSPRLNGDHGTVSLLIGASKTDGSCENPEFHATSSPKNILAVHHCPFLVLRMSTPPAGRPSFSLLVSLAQILVLLAKAVTAAPVLGNNRQFYSHLPVCLCFPACQVAWQTRCEEAQAVDPPTRQVVTTAIKDQGCS